MILVNLKIIHNSGLLQIMTKADVKYNKFYFSMNQSSVNILHLKIWTEDQIFPLGLKITFYSLWFAFKSFQFSITITMEANTAAKKEASVAVAHCAVNINY